MTRIAAQLIDRRLPQYTAVYVGASWGLVQFLSFMEERYALSPHWTDLTLLALTLLLPSVLLFTYNHGRPGKDQLTPVEKVGIPLNLLFTVVVLFILFGNKELGATTTSVTTTDEAGNKVERVVPKASFRKRLALFDFEAPAGDTVASWLAKALPLGLAADLLQDAFVDVRQEIFFREKLRQLGYRGDRPVPLSLKRQIAEEQHLPYFLEGRVTAGPALELKLYETESGKLLQTRTFSDADPLALVDAVTVTLKQDLELPQTRQIKDLPVSEVLTSSVAAFRAWAEGVNAVQQHDDWQRAAQLLARATETDPTFAAAHLSLHNVLLMANQAQQSMAPLQKAMEHLYRLPERMQFDVKAEYYMMKQEMPKAMAVVRMKVDLFPEDISAYMLLAQLQLLADDKRGMIASYQKILELDPAQQEKTKEIAALYAELGEYDRALENYQAYARRFPKQYEPLLSIAQIQARKGQPDSARAALDKAATIDPTAVQPMLALARLETDLGRLDAAGKHINDAVAAARSAEDRFQALHALTQLHKRRGQTRAALAVHERALAEGRKFQPPLGLAFMTLGELDEYVAAGQTAAAQATLQRIKSELQAPFNMFAVLGEMEMLLELKRTAEAEQAVNVLQQLIAQTGFSLLNPALISGRARVAEQKREWRAALTRYQEALKLDPSDISTLIDIGRVYRELGEPRRALEQIGQALAAAPAHPRANLEIALAYQALGDQANALVHVRRALDIWQQADPGFEPAAQARTLLAQLGGTTDLKAAR